MGALIWLIVIGVMIYQAVKKNQELSSPKPGKQNDTAAPLGASREKRVMTDADRTKLENYRRQMQMGKKQTAGAFAAPVPDIVSRAKANSARYAADETLAELESEHRHSEHVAPAGAKHTDQAETKRAHTAPEEFVNPPEEESLLGSVEDLMVKGYDGNLSFERDFLGEAMDMLNSFTL